MDLNAYQVEAAKLNRHPAEHNLTLCGLGLGGECGEAIEHIKKYFRDGKQIDLKEFGLELGDILWYTSEAARAVGLTLEEIGEWNLQKLQARKAKRESKMTQGKLDLI